MGNFRGVVAVVLLLGGAEALAVEQFRTDLRLGFVPYSSSYLSASFGQLFRVNDAPLVVPDPRLAPEIELPILEDRRSLAERFDAARLAALGATEPVTPRLRLSHYKADAPGWQGFCDQWSTAAIHPQVSPWLAKTGGLVCGKVLLRRGDLEELFTAFFSLPDELVFLGERHRREMPREWAEVADLAGLYDLPAHVFHKEATERLRQGQGLVADFDTTVNVWNHPIYGLRSSITQYDSASELMELLPILPMDIFVADNKSGRKFLDRVARLDKLIADAVAGKATTEEYFAASAPFRSWFSRWFGSPPSYLSLAKKRRSVVAKDLGSLIRSGHVSLRQGVVVQDVLSALMYVSEDEFTRGGAPRENWRDLHYVLVVRDGVPVNSVWLTERHARLDFLWVPKTRDLESTAALRAEPYPYADALADLMELREKCVDMADVAEFFRQLDAAAETGVSAKDEEQMRHLYEKVRGVVRPEMVREKLRKVPGLEL